MADVAPFGPEIPAMRIADTYAAGVMPELWRAWDGLQSAVATLEISGRTEAAYRCAQFVGDVTLKSAGEAKVPFTVVGFFTADQSLAGPAKNAIDHLLQCEANGVPILPAARLALQSTIAGGISSYEFTPKHPDLKRAVVLRRPRVDVDRSAAEVAISERGLAGARRHFLDLSQPDGHMAPRHLWMLNMTEIIRGARPTKPEAS